MVHTKLQVPMTRRPMAQLVVTGLAITALALAILATAIWLVNFFTLYIPMGVLGVVPWIALALLNILCAASAWLLLSTRLSNSTRQIVWVTQGVFISTIIVGMWSIGSAFFPSWLLLLVGSVINHICLDKASISSVALRFVILIGTAALSVGFLLAISATVTPPTPPSPPPPAQWPPPPAPTR